MQQDELMVCENCHQSFPNFKIDLHEAYCKKNIKRCKICSKMVDVNDQESHHNQFHAEKSCQYCHSSFIISQLSTHKPIQCRHCQNPYPFSIIHRHENECGSRTKKCQTCRKYIKINAYEEHMVHCQIIQIPRNQSQEQRRIQNQIAFRERGNSNQHFKKQMIQAHSPRLINKNAMKPVLIDREPISQLVDPVPISVRVTMQRQREKVKRK